MNIPRDAQVSEKEQFELLNWTIIEKKYALRSSTNKDLKVPEKPKLKCMGFTNNGAKLFNMLQSLTKAIIFELFYYINGYFRVWLTSMNIQNAIPTYYINQFFMG